MYISLAYIKTDNYFNILVRSSDYGGFKTGYVCRPRTSSIFIEGGMVEHGLEIIENRSIMERKINPADRFKFTLIKISGVSGSGKSKITSILTDHLNNSIGFVDAKQESFPEFKKFISDGKRLWNWVILDNCQFTHEQIASLNVTTTDIDLTKVNE
jgi:hypothetical protein